MAPIARTPLCKVDVYASSVLDSSLDETWQHARNFGQAPWWASSGQGQFSVKWLGPRAAAEIGCERIFSIGSARLFEELTALDDMEHIVRWVVVSHPQTLTPFGQASFMNYTSSMQLRAVTMTNQTFAEWRGQFYTEPHYAAQMESMLQSWYYAGFRGLEMCASGLESLEAIEAATPYPPTSLNPNYSIPVQPPPVEQVAFHSPLEARPADYPPTSHAQSRSNDSRSSLSKEQYTTGAGMATNSSHAWQAARAAFGAPQAPSGSLRGSAKSAASPVSPLPHPSGPAMPMENSMPANSNPMSSEDLARYMNGRRAGDIDPAMLGYGSEGPPIGSTAAFTAPNPYHSHLSSIQEGMQAPNATLDLLSQGPMSKAQALHRTTSNTSAGPGSSKCSSMSSNHSQNTRSVLRGQAAQMKSPSLDGASYQDRGQPAVPRRSWQENEHYQSRPPSASAMKEEALQKLKIGNGHRANDRRSHMRKNLQPDWANMKETADIQSDQDARLMAGVAKNMGLHHREKTQRTSLEEEVAKLQERHEQLHGPRQSTTDRPFVSPFSASPFDTAQQASNPFAAAQTTQE